MTGRPARPIGERIRDGIAIDENGCWVWQRFSQYGYGKIFVGSWTDNSRRNVPAHRASYEAFVGPIPEGMQIDHLCRNTLCVNPEHLEPVTATVNARRRTAAQMGLASCPNGHAQTKGAAIYYRGKRYCRHCRPDLVQRRGAA